MLQIGLTGRLLIKRLNLYDDDILLLVKQGLQPYGEYWKPILPPDSEELPREIAVLMRRKSIIEDQYPEILNSSCSYLFVTKEIDSRGKPKNIKYPDGTTTKVRIRYELINAKIDKLQSKCSWINYIFPQGEEEKEKIKETLLNARYKMEDVPELENRQEHEELRSDLSEVDDTQIEDIQGKTVDSTGTMNNRPAHAEAISFFTRENNDLWHVGFEGQKARIRHLDGIYYIAILLKNPGTSVSCRELYSAIPRRIPDNVMSAGAAMDQGLNISISRSTQILSDKKARDDYAAKYRNLQNDLENAESELERQEIEKEMAKIMPFLKQGTFADPNEKKVQINIKKRLETAYQAIHKTGMKKLAKHLRDHIKPDKAYGQIYIGSFAWAIML
jgi:hypothetical protein